MNKISNLFITFHKNIKQSGIKKTIKKIYQRSINFSAYKLGLLTNNKKNNELLIDIVNYKTGDRLETQPILETNKKIAIHLHVYYIDMINKILTKLENIEQSFDIFISISDISSIDIIKLKTLFKNRLKKVNVIEVEVVENRGRDIGPLIVTFGKRLSEYDFICHIHTKKSVHMVNGEEWGDFILEKLLGSAEIVRQNLVLLNSYGKILFPAENIGINMRNGGWDSNYLIARKLLAKFFKIKITDFDKVVFPQGMMFWARVEAVEKFLSLPLVFSDFPKEPLDFDGSVAHALERIILITAIGSGGKSIRLI